MRVIVYTAILGTCDSLKPAPAFADRSVCFVDNPADYPDPKGWELIAHAYTGDPRREAWRLRCVPHELFPEYGRVIWIDASFTLTDLQSLLLDAGHAPIAALRHHARHSCFTEGDTIIKVKQARSEDVWPQMQQYARDGFKPKHLSISCIIVRDDSDTARQFNETWASEIRRHLGDNTQLSLDYSAWLNGTEIKSLVGTRHKNPYSTHDHLDHKKRRKPYQVPA